MKNLSQFIEAMAWACHKWLFRIISQIDSKLSTVKLARISTKPTKIFSIVVACRAESISQTESKGMKELKRIIFLRNELWQIKTAQTNSNCIGIQYAFVHAVTVHIPFNVLINNNFYLVYFYRRSPMMFLKMNAAVFCVLRPFAMWHFIIR